MRDRRKMRGARKAKCLEDLGGEGAGSQRRNWETVVGKEETQTDKRI